MELKFILTVSSMKNRRRKKKLFEINRENRLMFHGEVKICLLFLDLCPITHLFIYIALRASLSHLLGERKRFRFFCGSGLIDCFRRI